MTTLDTCKKSLDNPTNVASPVSPISPANPASVISTQTQTVTATPSAPSTPTITGGSVAPIAGSSVQSSTAQTDAKGTTTQNQTATPSLGLKLNNLVGLVASLELFVKPNLPQYNAFPVQNIGQEFPNDIKILQQTYMDLITNGSLFNPDQTELFGVFKDNQVELEQ